MNNRFMFAVLAAVLAVGMGATADAHAWSTERNENGQKHLNGHEVPRTDSIKAHVMGEVMSCTWFVDNCDLSWIPSELVDWLKSTNSYKDGNLHILN